MLACCSSHSTKGTGVAFVRLTRSEMRGGPAPYSKRLTSSATIFSTFAVLKGRPRLDQIGSDGSSQVVRS